MNPNGRPPTAAPTRFWEKVQKTDTCWIWQGAVDHFGYGRFWIGHKQYVMVHRYSYFLEFGPIPKGMEIDHKCFNTSCVNPAHLRLSTPTQNSVHRRVSRDHQGSSGHRNVYWHRGSKKWRVMVSLNNKLISGGLFSDLNEAIKKAQQLRDEYYGTEFTKGIEVSYGCQ